MTEGDATHSLFGIIKLYCPLLFLLTDGKCPQLMICPAQGIHYWSGLTIPYLCRTDAGMFLLLIYHFAMRITFPKWAGDSFLPDK